MWYRGSTQYSRKFYWSWCLLLLPVGNHPPFLFFYITSLLSQTAWPNFTKFGRLDLHVFENNFGQKMTSSTTSVKEPPPSLCCELRRTADWPPRRWALVLTFIYVLLFVLCSNFSSTLLNQSIIVEHALVLILHDPIVTKQIVFILLYYSRWLWQ